MHDRHFVTQGIVLSRTSYQEADRIVTLLTPDGKVQLIAKGVRKPKSKLAGGVELFSVSELGVIKGKGSLDTLSFARLRRHFGNIAKDLARTQFGYEVLKLINHLTEEAAGPEFYTLLEDTLAALDDPEIDMRTTRLWFNMQLLRQMGSEPNLTTDKSGTRLTADQKYGFDMESMVFTPRDKGFYTADHIKVLRLSLSATPATLQKVKFLAELESELQGMVLSIRQQHLRA